MKPRTLIWSPVLTLPPPLLVGYRFKEKDEAKVFDALEWLAAKCQTRASRQTSPYGYDG